MKQALDAGRYDTVYGGARRDEEKSRAKERVFSVRDRGHVWNPEYQRAELWPSYNMQLTTGQSIRVIPLCNWTEWDIWRYADQRKFALAPLYFAAPQPVLERGGILLVVDDPERMRFQPGDVMKTRSVRFRTRGAGRALDGRSAHPPVRSIFPPIFVP